MKSKKLLILILVVAVVLACVIVVFVSKAMNASNGTQPTEAGNTYRVTFYSDDGTILKIDTARENAAAVPPHNPQLTYGKLFLAWDKDFSNVTGDMEVYPVYEDIRNKPNVFSIGSVYTSNGGRTTISVMLGGNVCASGFDIVIRYNADVMQLESILEDGAVVYNVEESGVIRMNYVSAENTVADVDISDLTFTVNAASGEFPIEIEVISIYACNDTVQSMDDTMYKPDYTVFNGMVYVIA